MFKIGSRVRIKDSYFNRTSWENQKRLKQDAFIVRFLSDIFDSNIGPVSAVRIDFRDGDCQHQLPLEDIELAQKKKNPTYKEVKELLGV